VTLKRIFEISRGAIVILLAPLFLLGGCGVFGKKEPPLPCPPVYLVKQAAFLTQYQEGGLGDITDVRLRNRIVDFKGECTYKRKNTELTVVLSVVFDMTRGAANRDRRAEFSYFVAMPKFHPDPAGKRVFGVAANFRENETRKLAVDTVEIKVPIARKGALREYAIYIGFQLTPQQLEDNKRRFDAFQRR